MRKIKFTALLTILLPLVAGAQEAKVYRWVDENGVVHFGDSIPAKYAELPKQVLNDHGVAVEELEGKKTPEQIEAERIEKERLMAIELRKRADQAHPHRHGAGADDWCRHDETADAQERPGPGSDQVQQLCFAEMHHRHLQPISPGMAW